VANYSKKEQDILKNFGENLRLYRSELGISQEKLAELCNLHRTYIGSAERGERNVSIINLFKISKALGIRPNVLI